MITFEAYMEFIDILDIWSVKNHNFNDIALNIFQYQAKNNVVYAKYLELINQPPHTIHHFEQIPFLPISFFKTHHVVTGNFVPEHTFESSTTTGSTPSKHAIKDLDLYHTNSLQIIEDKLGKISSYEIFGLLPSYLERGNSSLVDMVQFLMEHNKQSHHFYLDDFESLIEAMASTSRKKLLFGVSFALLDFAKIHSVQFPDLTIIETGGMKGRVKEITKLDLYQKLQLSFKESSIFSEYGMTELLSQAYSDENHIYTCPPWMRVLPRKDNDPFSHSANGHTAALNIIDLANIHSCCFIATDDLGKVYTDGRFEVTGRLDISDLRGCSLMAV